MKRYKQGPGKRRVTRRAQRIYIARLKESGWRKTTLWFDARLNDQMASMMQRLQVTKQVLLMTALELGLRSITPSVLITMEQRWRAYVGPTLRDTRRRGEWIVTRSPKGHVIKMTRKSQAA